MIAKPDMLHVRTFIIFSAVIFAALLAMPGRTIVASYINDIFIFLDGAHRIAAGQVPNRDFHTALGPLSFYIPALGFWITGDMGKAMPFGLAVTTLFLAFPIAHVLGTRLRPFVAIPYGVFLLLILAVPLNLGESVTELSFGMFYNRIGWAALGTLLVLYLRSDCFTPKQSMLDMICAVILTLIMLYTKITYGLVAIAFLVFLLSDPRQRQWVAGALGLTIAGLLIVEAFWQSSGRYLADIIMASSVSGSWDSTDLAHSFLKHMADYIIFAMLAALTIWRRHALRDIAFLSFCALTGLLIQNQNAQPWGIMTLHAGAVVAVSSILPSRQTIPPSQAMPALAYGPLLLLMALILPTLLHNLTALSFHVALSTARAGEAFRLPQYGNIRIIAPWLSGEKTMMHAYLESVEEGARELERLPIKPKNVAVLDFANPFSAGLDLAPPKGGSAWLHWGRNINASHFISPEQMFAHVEVLMVPKWGINDIPLRSLYQPYVEADFESTHESNGWIIYRRRSNEIASKSGGLGESEDTTR